MRIISQDGAFDLPYDRLFLGRKEERGKYVIIDIEHGIILATYGTLDTCEAVMIMLKEEYYTYMCCTSPKRFRFPTEEEIKEKEEKPWKK